MSASAPAAPVAAIGMCASVGGPAVLEEILCLLPADFATPILVVQHIAVGFSAGLVRMLEERIAMPVAMAQDGERLCPGVWIAPDEAHLLVTRAHRLELDADIVSGRHRPSADVLLESMAGALGAAAVAVILSGMGRDGARGAAEIKARGGLLLAQDEATSRIYGMPRAAAQAGARALSPPQIAAVLRSRCAST